MIKLYKEPGTNPGPGYYLKQAAALQGPVDFDFSDEEEEKDLSADFDAGFVPEFSFNAQSREYQDKCCSEVRKGWEVFCRQLIVMAGGTGKTIVFSKISREEVARGGRVLILVHTEELLQQAKDKLYKSTGLEAEIEKASEHASPDAAVVIASVQTLARIDRLTGFADNHFTLVICDEAHRGLSPSHLRVQYYFHFGAKSLDQDFQVPNPGEPHPYNAKLLGVTATPSRGDRRSLGELYQNVPFEYGLLEAVRDGYLVRPIVKNIPLKIDVRGVKLSGAGGRGKDLDAKQVAERIIPLIRKIAQILAREAAELKTVVFLPSIETARMLSEALAEEGMNASFVSGMCEDREDKIAKFREAGSGSILCNALLLVEGFDVPDITGVCVLRPTKIWSFYVQAVVRGTRPLTGILDGLTTKEERLHAIENSDKKVFYVFDFFFASEGIDLCQPVDLVATTPEIRKRMIAAGVSDLMADEEVAQRDFLKAVAKAAKKAANREARTVDPLQQSVAVSMGDPSIVNWRPEKKWDSDPISKGQIAFLKQAGVDADKVKFKGLANKLITRILMRRKSGMAEVRQIQLALQLGIPEDKCAMLTKLEASALIDATLKEKKERREAEGQDYY